MEAGEQGEIGIMDECGIKRDRRARGTPAKEVHRAALPDEPHRRFPGLRLANGLNNHVEDRARRDGGRQPALLARIQDQFRPEALGRLESLFAPARHRHVAAQVPGQRDKHKANRAGTNDQHALPGAQLDVFDPLHHASQGLDQRRVTKSGLRLEPQQVLLHEPRRDNNRLGVGAVQEQQIVAQVFLVVEAVEAFPAGR